MLRGGGPCWMAQQAQRGCTPAVSGASAHGACCLLCLLGALPAPPWPECIRKKWWPYSWKYIATESQPQPVGGDKEKRWQEGQGSRGNWLALRALWQGRSLFNNTHSAWCIEPPAPACCCASAIAHSQWQPGTSSSSSREYRLASHTVAPHPAGHAVGIAHAAVVSHRQPAALCIAGGRQVGAAANGQGGVQVCGVSGEHRRWQPAFTRRELFW